MTASAWFSILGVACLGYATMWVLAYVRISPPQWLASLIVWLWKRRW